MVLDLLRRLPKFNPERAQLNTFIARVVEHKVATIIEARKAGIRDYRLCNCSLNDCLEDEEGGSVERIETTDQEDYLLRTGKLSRPAAELRDLSIDVRKVIEQLPPKLRELCRRLMTDTVTRISHETGIPRGTIYEFIKNLRAIFEDAGLRDYLRPSDGPGPLPVGNDRVGCQQGVRESPKAPDPGAPQTDRNERNGGKTVNRELYRYNFDSEVPIRDVEESLFLAVLAAECLHGRSLVRLDASFCLDPKKRSCVVDSATEVGRAIARIFTGFLSREFGEEAFKVKRVGDGPAVGSELKATGAT